MKTFITAEHSTFPHHPSEAPSSPASAAAAGEDMGNVYDLMSKIREKRAVLAEAKDEQDAAALYDFVEESKSEIEKLVMEIKRIYSAMWYRPGNIDNDAFEQILTDLHEELSHVREYVAAFNARKVAPRMQAND